MVDSNFALPHIMGHRGAAAVAPENTLVGMRAAAEQGVTWVEFDVMLTGDGVPVLFHDDNLKRTTGRDAPMAQTPLAELRTLEAGAWFDPAFAGAPIPTLEEALALLLELGLSPNIEIKPTPGADEPTAQGALEVLIRCWPLDSRPALVSSFSRRSLAVAQREAPQVPRGFLCWRVPREWAKVATALECTTVHAAANYLSPRMVDNIKAKGYPLAVFTVNDDVFARHLVECGVDCVITDDPAKIAAALG
jgi:glycerophosphoryl diester phosphodiesterase